MAKAYQKIVIDMDICIGCGACVSVCPYNALEMDENGKARLIWDLCKDDFSCIKVCPVNCIWETEKAPDPSREKPGWYRFSMELTPEEMEVFNNWRSRYGIKWAP
jgi:ferredoxin